MHLGSLVRRLLNDWWTRMLSVSLIRPIKSKDRYAKVERIEQVDWDESTGRHLDLGTGQWRCEWWSLPLYNIISTLVWILQAFLLLPRFSSLASGATDGNQITNGNGGYMQMEMEGRAPSSPIHSIRLIQSLLSTLTKPEQHHFAVVHCYFHCCCKSRLILSSCNMRRCSRASVCVLKVRSERRKELKNEETAPSTSASTYDWMKISYWRPIWWLGAKCKHSPRPRLSEAPTSELTDGRGERVLVVLLLSGQAGVVADGRKPWTRDEKEQKKPLDNIINTGDWMLA